MPNSIRLSFLAGYSRSRLGKELLAQLQPRGINELERAHEILTGALKLPEDLLDYDERRIQGRIYRSLVVTLDAIIRTLQASDLWKDQDQCLSYAEEVIGVLSKWQSEHPDDFYALTESDRIEPRLRQLIRDLHRQKESRQEVR